MEEKLELRMYGLVPYNISPIQQAIQFGHAVVEYGQMVKSYKTDDVLRTNFLLGLYNDWADNWKTFIILNGGTSNHSINRYHDVEFIGSMEKHLQTLNEIGVINATFYEPDLNDMLSAVVFIVDERVFNRKKYPDLGDWLLNNKNDFLVDRLSSPYKFDRMRQNGYFQTDANKEEREIYLEWEKSIGGEKNVKVRDFLSGLKLA
jgi:hypothetical protein